jgi:hypothetical protein
MQRKIPEVLLKESLGVTTPDPRWPKPDSIVLDSGPWEFYIRKGTDKWGPEDDTKYLKEYKDVLGHITEKQPESNVVWVSNTVGENECVRLCTCTNPNATMHCHAAVLWTHQCLLSPAVACCRLLTLAIACCRLLSLAVCRICLSVLAHDPSRYGGWGKDCMHTDVLKREAIEGTGQILLNRTGLFTPLPKHYQLEGVPFNTYHMPGWVIDETAVMLLNLLSFLKKSS